MELIRLTPENASQYVGYSILFKSRNELQLSKILDVSDSGKSVQIQHNDLESRLQTVSRKIYVIVEDQLGSYIVR